MSSKFKVNKKFMLVLFFIIISVVSLFIVQQLFFNSSSVFPSSKSTPTLLLNVNTTTVKIGENIQLIANLSTPASGKLLLQWAIGSSGFMYQTNETLTNGVFTRSFGFQKADVWQFRVYWDGDSSFNSVYSEIISVDVEP